MRIYFMISGPVTSTNVLYSVNNSAFVRRSLRFALRILSISRWVLSNVSVSFHGGLFRRFTFAFRICLGFGGLMHQLFLSLIAELTLDYSDSYDLRLTWSSAPAQPCSPPPILSSFARCIAHSHVGPQPLCSKTSQSNSTPADISMSCLLPSSSSNRLGCYIERL